MKIGRITYFIPFYNIEVLLWCMYSGGLNNGNIYPWLLQYMPLNGPNHSYFNFSITKLFNVFWNLFKCPCDRASVYGLTRLLLHKFIILLDKVIKSLPALIAHCCWFWPPDELPGVPWYPEEATSEWPHEILASEESRLDRVHGVPRRLLVYLRGFQRP